MSKEYPGNNRGFAFIEFYNHACAQLAKNALSAPTYTCASFFPPIHHITLEEGGLILRDQWSNNVACTCHACSCSRHPKPANCMHAQQFCHLPACCLAE